LLNTKSQVSFYAVILLSLLSLAGCGGSSSNTNVIQQQSVVAIAGTPPTAIGVGANWQYAATVNGVASQAITWKASAGTIDGTGLYIAPLTVPSPASVTITATSQADSTQSATASVTVQATDPLGTVASYSQLNSCPGGGLANGTCFQVNTSCPGVADYSVYLKVNTPPVNSVGTVIFGTGTGGSTLYDNDPTFTNGNFNGGLQVVEGAVNNGYTTVQISFGAPFNSTNTENGWLQGPGGVRRLACRYATVADWISKNEQVISPSASASVPMCATGNSGGSGAIAYAVTVYGLATEFAMIEPTSGPVMTRIDEGCTPSGSFTYEGTTACSNAYTDMSYSIGGAVGDGTAGVIDAAYQSVGSTTPTPCTDGVNGVSSSNTAQFLSDSIWFNPAQAISIPKPPTTINQVFGGMDTSNAVPQGETWWSKVGPQPTQACVADAPHAIPSAPDGAQHILDDITSLCH
jgi:hypothetical protein